MSSLYSLPGCRETDGMLPRSKAVTTLAAGC